jgi:hypothetical protein
MSAFLDSEWFDRARELVVGVGSMPGIGYRIQFDADGHRWYQVAVDGAITEWADGDLDGPDMEIRLPLDVARRIHRGAIDGTEALGACTVAMPDGWTGPPTPIDIIDQPELDDLPEQPDADLLIQYRHSAGPFGPMSWWWRFVQGRSDSGDLGEIEEPDVIATLPFAKTVSLRLGNLSIYEAIEGGRLEGDVGPLMLLGGLLEAPEHVAAREACGHRGIPLANLGLVTSQPEVRAALDALAAETT